MSHQSPLKVLAFRRKPSSPTFLYASGMPSREQEKLSGLMVRFDKVMKRRPAVAARIMFHVELVFQMFNA